MGRVHQMDASAPRNDEQHAQQLSLAYCRIAERSWNRPSCFYCRKTEAFLTAANKAIEPIAIEESSHCTSNVFAFFDCARGLRYRPGLRDSNGSQVAACRIPQVSSHRRCRTSCKFV